MQVCAACTNRAVPLTLLVSTRAHAIAHSTSQAGTAPIHAEADDLGVTQQGVRLVSGHFPHVGFYFRLEGSRTESGREARRGGEVGGPVGVRRAACGVRQSRAERPVKYYARRHIAYREQAKDYSAAPLRLCPGFYSFRDGVEGFEKAARSRPVPDGGTALGPGVQLALILLAGKIVGKAHGATWA